MAETIDTILERCFCIYRQDMIRRREHIHTI